MFGEWNIRYLSYIVYSNFERNKQEYENVFDIIYLLAIPMITLLIKGFQDPSTRGPLCLNCSNVIDKAMCHSITLCQNDQVCFTQELTLRCWATCWNPYTIQYFLNTEPLYRRASIKIFLQHIFVLLYIYIPGNNRCFYWMGDSLHNIVFFIFMAWLISKKWPYKIERI